MPLWLAAALLLLAAAGIVLSCRCLGKCPAARTLCIVGCALSALACAGDSGLRLLFVDAVRNRPPTGCDT